MSKSQSKISINVDVTNPGQFFACCGLLELADRLWPGAEGWFEEERFLIAAGTLRKMVDAIASLEIRSSLTDTDRRRLGTLLSAAKSSLTRADQDEKVRLQAAWKVERLYVSTPFEIWLDWWRDAQGSRTELKTWAAKQMVAEMASAMASAIRRDLQESPPTDGNFFRPIQDNSLPFNFDSDQCRAGNSRDAGFSADTLSLKCKYRPLLELLAFIGLQRFRPSESGAGFKYSVWHVPLPLSVAGVVASGHVQLTGNDQYSFGLFHRTKYMKAFLPAHPCQRSLANV